MDNAPGRFKRNLISVILFSFLGSAVFGLWQANLFNDDKLHLIFCDVGQGDAIYLKTPGGQEVLIDGGPDEKVLDCLSSHRPFYDRKVEILALTHPEADHLTGLISVLERYEVDYLILENIFMPTAVFAKFQKAVVGKKPQIFNPKAGDRIKLGEVEVLFDWPEKAIGDKSLWGEGEDKTSMAVGQPNDYSLVIEIKYKNFKALLTGDAEEEILARINNPEGTTILKVPHHGSKGGLSKGLLEILKPKLAVVSVGRGNRYGHPDKGTLNLLQDFGIKTLRTDQDGEVEIESDGQVWRLN